MSDPIGVINIGNTGVREITGGEHDFDPSLGYVFTRVYEGDEDSLISMGAGFQLKGWKANVFHHAGPVWRLRVSIPKVPLNQIETPIDTWGWDTELAQESIFSNPRVIASTGLTGAAADDLLAQWKKDFKSKLKENDLPSTTGFSDRKLELYTLLQRGQEAVEVERLVLRRRRTFTLLFPAPIQLNSIPRIYTSTQLIHDFDIPSKIQAQFPATPGPSETPQYTTWGWKKRRDSSEILIASGRVEETKDFLFAAWSNLPHYIQ